MPNHWSQYGRAACHPRVDGRRGVVVQVDRLVTPPGRPALTSRAGIHALHNRSPPLLAGILRLSRRAAALLKTRGAAGAAAGDALERLYAADARVLRKGRGAPERRALPGKSVRYWASVCG